MLQKSSRVELWRGDLLRFVDIVVVVGVVVDNIDLIGGGVVVLMC